MKRLVEIGFRKVGEWNLTQSGIEYSLHDCADAHNILYCFVCEKTVLYVGETTNSLKERMYQYQKPGPSQSTNIKCNKNICTLLSDGRQVDIFALPDNGLLHFGGFHINLAAGLEYSIVKTLNPSWNKTGTANN